MVALKGLLQRIAIGAFASLAAAANVTAKPPPCLVIEIAGLAQPGTDGARAFPAPTSDRVTVERASIITIRDVATADTSYADGAWGLGLRFNPKAAARMRAYTAAHVGDQVAFIVQGRAKMVVKILDPNMGDGAWISPFAKDKGDALAAEINACVKPLR